MGFSFSFLSHIRNVMGEEDVARLVAQRIFENFRTTRSIDDAMMESPVTLLNLGALGQFHLSWTKLLREHFPDLSAHVPVLQSFARVEKQLSDRYVQHLRAIGKSPDQISRALRFIRTPSSFPFHLDVGRALRYFSSDNVPKDKVLEELIAQSQRLFDQAVQAFDQPQHSTKTGLNFEVK